MRRTQKAVMPAAPVAPVPSEILDQLVRQGPISHEELDAAVRRFKKAIIERAWGGELTHHLGYPAGLAEVTAWQSRPLETMYPVVFFDALRVKIRDAATVRSKAIYLALAVRPDGRRGILGLWIEQTEGPKFWMKVFTDLKTRGCQDILIAVTNGLKGMPEALAAIFPATTLQTCIVHLLRASLDSRMGRSASWLALRR